MKNFTNTTTKRIIAKAEATGFDKLSYFNHPDETHKNFWLSDKKTGLTHLVLQSLKINTVDTDTYEEHQMGLTYWTDDLSHTTKRKGKFGYVTGTTTINGKTKNVRQMKVITNTVGLGRKVQVDHLNGNTYDDRRINLSTGTQQDNLKNQYPYKEVPSIIYPWDHE